jgi:hypothetical protein
VLNEKRNEKNSTLFKNEENWKRDGAKKENTEIRKREKGKQTKRKGRKTAKEGNETRKNERRGESTRKKGLLTLK